MMAILNSLNATNPQESYRTWYRANVAKLAGEKKIRFDLFG